MPDSLNLLASKLAQDPASLQKFKDDPLASLKDEALLQAPVYTQDIFIYRFVVIVLGVVVLGVAAAGIYYKIAWGNALDSTVLAFGATALGAIAGLLAPSPARNSN